MKSMTISEGLRAAVGERKVELAFFSTYCLEVDFFELYVMPLLLGDGNGAWSTDETIRAHQLQYQIGSHGGRYAVAYDVDVFAAQVSGKLEVDYLPVRVPDGCQHAKLIVLAVSGADGKRAILLAAGSFNLTQAGWWSNMEAGHWVELSNGKAPGNLVRPLASALQYFEGGRKVGALSALRATLGQWKAGPDDPGCQFYFSGAGRQRRSFPQLLQDCDHQYLEVVSPYFSDQGDHPEVVSFLSAFGRTSLLLPTDESGAATMTELVHRQLSAHVQWTDWHATMRKEHSLPAGRSDYRRLHAKMYAGKGWYFVGSVNLSYKALYRNVEAGFLLTGQPALKLLGPEVRAQAFSAVDEAEAPEVGTAASMPPVVLVYDWQSGQLEALSPVSGRLTLFDAQGDACASLALLANELYAAQISTLAQQLKQSALVSVQWLHPADPAAPSDQPGVASARHTLLVSQRHVFCRPSSLPELSVRDLLRIFQNMDLDAGMELITELANRHVRLSHAGVYNEFLPALPASDEPGSFFSEFSEVNGAFWNLRKKLSAASAAGRHLELAYYLEGQQPDSLPSLAKSLAAVTPEVQLPLIVRYLTLLNLDEVLALYALPQQGLPARVGELLVLAEQDPQFLALPPGYLDWIKAQFRSTVRHDGADSLLQESQNG